MDDYNVVSVEHFCDGLVLIIFKFSAMSRITVILILFYFYLSEGSATVFYLFVRGKFDWSIQQSTFYDAASIIIIIFGNIVGMYILNKVRTFMRTISCWFD